MKAAQISDYGHADAIQVVEIEKPEVTEGMVLVEVHASSLNPWDTTVREGYAKEMVPLQLPVTLGGDLAGIVSAVGSGVTGVAVGDKVYGDAGVAAGGSGAFAEYALTRTSHIAVMPNNLDFITAGAAPLTGLSALQAIQEHLKLQAGQKILIHGGAGGIGTVAIQIAKHLGAYVATTATGDGLEYVKSLGADEVIDYRSQQFDDLLHDYDAVFDTVAGEAYARSFMVLKPGGTIVSMLAPADRQLMERFKVTAIFQQTRTTTESLNMLTKLIEDGVVTIHVDQIFPLEQIAAAFTTRENDSIRGKVAIQVR